MTRVIIWTGPARNDLASIHEYIAKDSEYYAKIFVSKLIHSVDKLLKFPTIGRVVPEYQNELIREIIVDPYRIIYRIDEDFLHVLAVVHGRRDLSRIKLKE